MWSQDKNLFPLLEEMCGNKFLAIKFLATCARRLASKLPKWIIESKLITWALTGQEPDVERYVNRDIDPDIQEVQDMLCYISDPNIQYCVKESYTTSVHNHHLIYVYRGPMSEYEEARVRVLVRILWCTSNRRIENE